MIREIISRSVGRHAYLETKEVEFLQIRDFPGNIPFVEGVEEFLLPITYYNQSERSIPAYIGTALEGVAHGLWAVSFAVAGIISLTHGVHDTIPTLSKFVEAKLAYNVVANTGVVLAERRRNKIKN